MSELPITIGIAVVAEQDRYLVGTRGPDGPLPGLAEFPGGKCRPQETPEQCAVRECLEETGMRVIPVRPLLRRTHCYPHGTVDLHFWLCRPAEPVIIEAERRGFRWIAADELHALTFPEANAPVIEMLSEGNSV